MLRWTDVRRLALDVVAHAKGKGFGEMLKKATAKCAPSHTLTDALPLEHTRPPLAAPWTAGNPKEEWSYQSD